MMKKLVQISAGQGPAECTWVVAQVLKKILLVQVQCPVHQLCEA